MRRGLEGCGGGGARRGGRGERCRQLAARQGLGACSCSGWPCLHCLPAAASAQQHAIGPTPACAAGPEAAAATPPTALTGLQAKLGGNGINALPRGDHIGLADDCRGRGGRELCGCKAVPSLPPPPLACGLRGMPTNPRLTHTAGRRLRRWWRAAGVPQASWWPVVGGRSLACRPRWRCCSAARRFYRMLVASAGGVVADLTLPAGTDRAELALHAGPPRAAGRSHCQSEQGELIRPAGAQLGLALQAGASPARRPTCGATWRRLLGVGDFPFPCHSP